jgi:hypothetical protein
MIGVPYEEIVRVVGDKNDPKHKEYKHWRQTAKVLTYLMMGSYAATYSVNDVNSGNI